MQNTQLSANKDPIIIALKQLKGYFLYATLFSASINILMLTPILYMLQVYDRVVSSGSMTTLIMLTILMGLLLVSSGGFEWARSRVLISANVRLENQLRDSVSSAGFKHSLISGNPAASNLAMSDLVGLRQFVTGNGIFAFMDAPWTPIYIAVMFLFHPLFGISAVVCAVIMLVLAILMEKLTAKKLIAANQLSSAASLSYQSNLRNAEAIHGMGMEANIREKDSRLHLSASIEQARGSALMSRLTAFSKSFRLIAQSLVLGLGAYLALNQQISPGMMIAGSLLLGRALAPIDMMVGNWKAFTEAKNQFRRLRNILLSIPSEPERLDLPSPTGNLSVEQLIIVPPGAESASVKGVGFELNAGDALGIIGPSAAGKTSLARGLLGIWPSRVGTVRLDGADIGKWDRQSLGKYIGYLPQDIELFDGSIADNICRFSERNSEIIIEAAKNAGIHEMILRLPEGYNTIISPTSGALSAGQRQRVGLARAIYNFPKLIILDEPNSNLDDQGERDLLSALRTMKDAGSTVIVITHRTSILTLTDKLLLMRDGLIANFGDRDQVLKAISDANKNVTKLQHKA